MGVAIELNGLEWLPWDRTVNMSVEEALSEYSPNDGWRLSSNSEVADLFNSLFVAGHPYIESSSITMDDISIPEFVDEENAEQRQWDPSSYSAFGQFIGLFGETEMSCKGYSGSQVCASRSIALVGEDADEDGLHNIAGVSYVYWTNHSNSYTEAFINADDSTPNISRPYGIALVLDLNPVPLPSTLPMFFTGLFSFSLFKYFKTKKRA